MLATSASMVACTVGKDGAPGPAGVPCNGCVNAASLAAGAVTAAAIQEGAIQTQQLAAKSVTGATIADGTVGAQQLAANAITGAGPIAVTNDSSTASISISRVGAAADGFLSSGDWTAFNNKQNAITAGSGLLLAGATSTLSANFTAASARNGVGTSVARGDHGHQIAIPVGVGDFDTQFGTPTKTKVSYGTLVAVPGWTLPQAGGSCVIATSVIPSVVTVLPTLVVDVHAAGVGTATVSTGSTGIAASAAPPSNCLNFSNAQNLVFGTANAMLRYSTTVTTLGVCGATPAATAGPGDILVFRICNSGAAGNLDFTVTSVSLIWN